MKNKYTINWLIPKLDKTKCTSEIENYILNAIKSQELQGGDLIPPYRELARTNKVSPSSVRRAYTKLTDNNWLNSNQGSGTFVSIRNPSENILLKTTGFKDHFPAGFLFLNKREVKQSAKFIEQPFIGVGTDFPNPATFPESKFLEYYNRIREASKNLSQAELLNAYDGRALKDAVVEQLNRKRDFGVSNQMIDIVKSRKSCLDRVFTILLNPDDVVISTSPYDLKLALALEKFDVTVFTVNRDEIDFIERIEQILEYSKVRAIHIRPQCSYPESFTLSQEYCTKLIELAKKYRVCIIEEEDDHEYSFSNTPYKPLACYEHDGYVLYMGALSKATMDTISLRVVVAATQFINEMGNLPKQSVEDRDVIKEQAIAEMIVNGDMAEYARQIRVKAKNYRDELHIVLNNHLHKYITYEIPENGLTFWIKFDERIDLNAVLDEVELLGIPVPYHPNSQRGKKKVNHMMLGYGAFDLAEAEGGAKMLSEVINGLNLL
ncbi:PLP-dependent aminotransferase family protein [Pedobacter nyackensis]|uniref:aminotransferase-like domain-containing protein n=1 Tax=Pedobacter nyackensis TaxID=475255 RepID=UPI00292F85C6|nr:PLP-dependent aminotransferase family protein [Pedobacter nyackensis]